MIKEIHANGQISAVIKVVVCTQLMFQMAVRIVDIALMLETIAYLLVHVTLVLMVHVAIILAQIAHVHLALAAVHILEKYATLMQIIANTLMKVMIVYRIVHLTGMMIVVNVYMNVAMMMMAYLVHIQKTVTMI
jgi:hypothetical protein